MSKTYLHRIHNDRDPNPLDKDDKAEEAIASPLDIAPAPVVSSRLNPLS